MEYCRKIALDLYLNEGYSDLESIHLSRIILSQRRCFKFKGLRSIIFKEVNKELHLKQRKVIRSTGWYAYSKEVRRLTEQNAPFVEGIEKRGFKDHHLDHKVSVWYGYQNNIPTKKIASIENLQMLPYKKNMKKGINVSNKDLINIGLETKNNLRIQ